MMKEYVHQGNQVGNVPEIESFYVVSLYDPKKGTIQHMHTALFTEGASKVESKQIERDAIAGAKKLGHDVKKLNILHTPNVSDFTSRYQVDLRRKKLVVMKEPEISDILARGSQTGTRKGLGISKRRQKRKR
jgi:hypothetical protein